MGVDDSIRLGAKFETDRLKVKRNGQPVLFLDECAFKTRFRTGRSEARIRERATFFKNWRVSVPAGAFFALPANNGPGQALGAGLACEHTGNG
jgi:hypothetical protein